MDGRLVQRLRKSPAATKCNSTKSTFSLRGSLRFWPLEYDQRDSLTREGELQRCPSAFCARTGRRADGRKVSRLLQFLILVRRWLRGRAHLLPDGIRVAVVGIDPIMCKFCFIQRRRHVLQRQVDFGLRPR